MAIENICSSGAVNALTNFIYPLTAMISVVTAAIIAVIYAYGNATNNPKFLLWSKTEIIQLIISVFVTVLFFGIITSFCSIDVRSLFSIFSVPDQNLPQSANPISVFDGAESYLVQSGTWVRDVMAAARYHIGAFNILEMYGRWVCDGPAGNPIVDIFFCIFGSYIGNGGGTGTSVSPSAGWTYLSPAMSVAFNALVISYMSILNYLFILRYIFSGFLFFFLPLGIFLRAMPFLRGLGSIMMSISISFVLIYPLVLSVFYIDFLSARLLAPDLYQPINSNADPDSNRFWGVGYYATEDISNKVGGNFGQVIVQALDLNGVAHYVFDYGFNPYLGGAAQAATGGVLPFSGIYSPNDRSFEIIQLSGNAFLIGIFIPSLSLLAAIGGAMYINRFLGEDVDLSRIVQVI